MSSSQLIRAKRYVSCRAGTYPAPSVVQASFADTLEEPFAPTPDVPPTQDIFASAESFASSEPISQATPAGPPAADSALDPAATMALDIESARAAVQADSSSDDGEFDIAFDDDQPAAEATSQAAEIPELPPNALDKTQPVPADVAASAASPATEDGTVELESTRRKVRPAAIIIWTLLGAVVGTFAGMTLLASSQAGNLWSNIQDPVGLWTAVTDPMLRISASLIAGGFAVLGLTVGARRSRS